VDSHHEAKLWDIMKNKPNAQWRGSVSLNLKFVTPRMQVLALGLRLGVHT